MVMLDPEIVSSLSFQLSVLATFALIAAMRLSERFEGWRSALATPTLASSLTGLATAPILAATFGTVSLATIPANLVAGPIVPIASIGGVLVVALEVVPPLAAVTGWVVWTLSALVLGVARVSAALPFGHVEFQPLRGAESAVVHLVVFAAIAAATPEGRLIRRRLVRWIEQEPRAAAAAGAGMGSTLITGLIVI
jgi:competence protein ComEC